MLRIYCCLIALFDALSVHAQGETSLRILLKDCRSQRVELLSSKVRLYHDGADTVAYSAVVNWKKDANLIKPILSGCYILEYEDLYQQTVRKPIIISSQTVNEVVLCLDETSSVPRNSLASLEKGDSIVIDIKSQGCFHDDLWERVVLTNAGGSIKAVWHAPDIRRSLAEPYDMKVESVTLDSRGLDAFRRFENELPLQQNMGCTSTTSYTVRSKHWNGNWVDGSCRWNGLNHLRQALFGKK